MTHMFAVGNQLPLFIYPAEIFDLEIKPNWTSCDGSNWDSLVTRKTDDCTPHFIDSCLYHGIEKPAGIKLAPGSPYPHYGNGHHRFAVALMHNLPLPVVFDDTAYYLSEWTEDPSLPDSSQRRFMDGDRDFPAHDQHTQEINA